MSRIAVLAGDGIGPEIIDAATRAIASVRPDIELQHCLVGGAAIDAGLPALPDETLATCRASDAILLGAVGGPKYDALPLAQRPERALLGVRQHFNLFANLRPIQTQNVDLVIVRELTGGLYFGTPKGIETIEGVRRAVDTMIYTEDEIRRVAHVAFQLAQRRRKRVLSVDKSNVLATSRLWREVVEEVAAEYRDVELSHMLVDSAAMYLLKSPREIDVLLTENTFGDILSDEAALLVESIGKIPSASIGNGTFGLFEPISGSAPDIAGKNLADSTGAVLSAALLLEHTYGDTESANAIRANVGRPTSPRVVH